MRLLPKKIYSDLGRKGRFVFWGFINIVLTNLVLQLLLLILNVSFATFISQIINATLGYLLYAKKVFRVEKYNYRSALFYLLLVLIIWNLNWKFIEKLIYLGLNKNLAALLLIPFLAIISYISQRYIIFGDKKIG